MQIPCVERPPASPPIRRQGQIASQLQASRYVPEIVQGAGSGIESYRAYGLASSEAALPSGPYRCHTGAPSAGRAMTDRLSPSAPSLALMIPVLALAALWLPAVGSPPPVAPAEADALTRQIRVGFGPLGVAVGGGAVWVTHADGRVSRIDVRTSRPVGRRIRLGGSADVAVGASAVWVTGIVGGPRGYSVSRVDPRTGRVVGSPIRTGERGPEASIGGGVAVGTDAVWVTNGFENTVRRVDPASGRVVGRPIPVRGVDAGDVAVGGGSVWVANGLSRTVSRIHERTGRLVGRPIAVGNAEGVAVGGGAVWVANFAQDSVSRIAVRTGRVVGRPIAVGDGPLGIAYGAGAVWVVNRTDGTVSRIAPRSGRVVGAPIAVGDTPGGIAVGAGAVWVANQGSDTVTRITP